MTLSNPAIVNIVTGFYIMIPNSRGLASACADEGSLLQAASKLRHKRKTICLNNIDILCMKRYDEVNHVAIKNHALGVVFCDLILLYVQFSK